MAFMFGFLTFEGKKVTKVEEIQLEVSREQDKVTPCDQIEPDEIIPTQLTYKLTFKKAYDGPYFFKAIKSGEPLGAILFEKDIKTGQATPTRDIRGIILDKDTLGPINGTKHAVEDISAGAAQVIELD